MVQNAAASSTDHWTLSPGNGTHHYLPATSRPFLCDDQIHIQHLPARQMLLIHGVWVPVFGPAVGRGGTSCVYRWSFAVCLLKSGVYVTQNPQRTGKSLSRVQAQAEIPSWVRNTESAYAVRLLFCTLLIPLHLRVTHACCSLMSRDAKIYRWVSGAAELQGGNPMCVLRSNAR